MTRSSSWSSFIQVTFKGSDALFQRQRQGRDKLRSIGKPSTTCVKAWVNGHLAIEIVNEGLHVGFYDIPPRIREEHHLKNIIQLA